MNIKPVFRTQPGHEHEPMEMTFIQIDLETLSLKPSAVVISLGAVAYNRQHGVISAIEMLFDLDEQIKAGRHINGETLTWWMFQSEEARQAAFGTDNVGFNRRIQSAEAVTKFNEWYFNVTHDFERVHSPQEVYMMANGNDFDLPILESYLGSVPYYYRKKICWRSLTNLYRGEYTYPEGLIAHSAIHDAHSQANAHMQLLNKYPERLSWVKSKPA